MVSCTPWMGGVVGGAANTPQSLQFLLAALGSTRKPLLGPDNTYKAAYVNIQADPDGAGTKFYVGSFSDMTSTDYGVYLVAGQPWGPPAVEFNLYRLDQIFLMADADSAKWKITFLTK